MTIGVDFGGTAIKIAEVDGANILRATSIPTPIGASPPAILDAIAGALGVVTPSPPTIGVAIPGEVDATGRCYRLPNVPGFEGLEIARELEVRTGARVVVENDGTAAALGERLFGHGRQHPSFIIVTLGTGIGGGLVLGRKLVRGAHGFAAEIGHVTVDSRPDAPACVCGNRGCLEAYAGTHALLAEFERNGGTASEIKDVADSARNGERAGLAVFAALADVLAIALNSIQNILDLDAIVFTGGVANSFDLVEPRLREALRKRCYAKPLGEVPLLVSELGDKAGVVGAAGLVAEIQP